VSVSGVRGAKPPDLVCVIALARVNRGVFDLRHLNRKRVPAARRHARRRKAQDVALAKIVEFQIGTESSQFLLARAKFYQSVANLIPEASEVSTTEFYMPALYQHGVPRLHFSIDTVSAPLSFNFTP